MKKLIFINACIRKDASRTWRIAAPVLRELSKHYTIEQIDLTDERILPVTNGLYHHRGTHGLTAQDMTWGQAVASADRIVIAAPFWDMSFPSVLKVFFEHISAPDVTFLNNEDGSTRGNCKAEKLLYITTRGMMIPTDSELDQGSSYLRALGWLWGIPQIHTLAVHGTDVKSPAVVDAEIDDAIACGIRLCEDF